MDIPANFQFTDNAAVNLVVDSRAAIIFGKDWKNRVDLEFSVVPAGDKTRTVVADNQSGWVLRVNVSPSSPDAIYSIQCQKNGMYEDPCPNIAAKTFLFSNGSLEHQTHHCVERLINPPDGTPSQVSFARDGSIEFGWYVNADGSLPKSPASKGEIAHRIASSKQASVAKLCTSPQEIIALATGKHNGCFSAASNQRLNQQQSTL